MAKIRIMFSRYSAFYSPLIATKAGGFLAAEGLDAEFAVAGAGAGRRGAARRRQPRPDPVGAVGELRAARARRDLGDRALRADQPARRLLRRRPPARSGLRLAEARRCAACSPTTARQPLAMLKYALHRQGVDYARLDAIDAGTPEAMVAAFKEGQGDYIHLQGPAPQQLEQDGAAHVLAAVGETVGPVAFSSLCATRSWLATDMAKAFMRAYAKSQEVGARASRPRRSRKRRGAVLPGRGRGGAGARRSRPTSASAAGRGRSRSGASSTRSRSTCSSTAA